MSKQIYKRSGAHLPDNCRPGWDILFTLGDKWTGPVLGTLSRDGRQRFSDIEKALPALSQRMLTLTLRRLERDGLVQREIYPTVPPRVEYELTEMGIGVLSALEGLNFWIRDNLPRIEQSRRLYDDAGQ